MADEEKEDGRTDALRSRKQFNKNSSWTVRKMPLAGQLTHLGPEKKALALEYINTKVARLSKLYYKGRFVHISCRVWAYHVLTLSPLLHSLVFNYFLLYMLEDPAAHAGLDVLMNDWGKD